MTVTVSVDQVTTEDVAPTVAPFKISAQAGETTATVLYTPNSTESHLCCSDDLDCSPTLACGDATNGRCIRVVRMIFNGSNRGNGKRVFHAGVMCGLDVCGGPDPGNLPLRIPQGTQRSNSLAYAATGPPADGDYDVSLYVFDSNTAAWS